MNIKRTHYCGDIRPTHEGKTICLSGWVDRYRDHGGVVFIDLRDRSGIVQVVFDPQTMGSNDAGTLRQEWVISVQGTVRKRPQGMGNESLATGVIEVSASKLEILSRSEPLPYLLHQDSPKQGEVDETVRGKYRYLELRTQWLQKNLRIRHEFLRAAREYYFQNGFWEIETPILYKSTPEGARDYLVPSRVHPGQFFALPQSPQTLKQLCMIGGLDRYVQIARCFRDEDLRADRQPEFTQIDVEMSFVTEEEIMTLHEGLMKSVFKTVLGEDIRTPFDRLPYSTAMRKYGSDKPDLRNQLTLVDLSEAGKKSSFQVYQNALQAGGVLLGLCFEEKENLSRSELDALPAKVAPYGAKGVSWIRIRESLDWQSPQAKFFSDELKREIESQLPFKKNAMLLMVCAKPSVAETALGALRIEFGNRFGYVDRGHRFCWITDFPLFEYSEAEGRFAAAHHPFTRPHPNDLETFLKAQNKEQIANIRACAYDLVLDGYEIGGGSLRIYDSEVQRRMFEILGFSEADAKTKFGFFLTALKYGTPPHGGIALGVDRISMLLSGTTAIRDVIAFPKTQKAFCLMSEAPGPVDPKQLEELHIRTVIPPPKE